MTNSNEPEWIAKAFGDLQDFIALNSPDWDTDMRQIASDAERSLAVFRARLDGDDNTPDAD